MKVYTIRRDIVTCICIYIFSEVPPSIPEMREIIPVPAYEDIGNYSHRLLERIGSKR